MKPAKPNYKAGKPRSKGGKYKGGRLVSFCADNAHGKARDKVRYKIAGKKDIGLFRKRGWLAVMKKSLDAVINTIAEQEKISRLEAMHIARKQGICPTRAFVLEKGKLWHVYSLRMDLRHGLFFNMEIKEERPNSPAAGLLTAAHNIAQRRYLEKGKQAKHTQ